MRTGTRSFTRVLAVLLSTAFATSLPLSTAQAIGKGMGKGKGAGAVAATSYHCLGQANQQVNTGSSYAYLANSYVIDAGDEAVTLEGAATGDLVVDSDMLAPNQMAEASINTDGLTLQPFDACGTSSGTVLNSVVTGISLTDPTMTGAAYVVFRINYHARLEYQSTGDPDGEFSAYTETTLQVPGFEEHSFRVSAEGELIVPPGLAVTAVTDLSVDDHHVFEVVGTYTAEGQLFYGPEVNNVVRTMFEAGGEVSSMNIEGSRIVAGFASAEALSTMTYEIDSQDPTILFSFVPVETAGEADTALAAVGEGEAVVAEDTTALAASTAAP